MEARPFLIGGKWKTSDSINEVRFPYTGEVIAKVCQASGDDIEDAIQAAAERKTALALGPGLSTSSETFGLVHALHESLEQPLVVRESEVHVFP